MKKAPFWGALARDDRIELPTQVLETSILPTKLIPCMGEVQDRTVSPASQAGASTIKLPSQFPHFESNKDLLAQNQTY